MRNRIFDWFFPLASTFVLVSSGIVCAVEPESAPDSSPAAEQSGYKAYLDPVSGRLGEAPPPGTMVIPLSDRELQQFSSSDVNLVPVTQQDGSLSLDLRGRYRQGSAATIDENGEVRIHRFGGEIFSGDAGQKIERQVLGGSQRPEPAP